MKLRIFFFYRVQCVCRGRYVGWGWKYVSVRSPRNSRKFPATRILTTARKLSREDARRYGIALTSVNYFSIRLIFVKVGVPLHTNTALRTDIKQEQWTLNTNEAVKSIMMLNTAALCDKQGSIGFVINRLILVEGTWDELSKWFTILCN